MPSNGTFRANGTLQWHTLPISPPKCSNGTLRVCHLDRRHTLKAHSPKIAVAKCSKCANLRLSLIFFLPMKSLPYPFFREYLANLAKNKRQYIRELRRNKGSHYLSRIDTAKSELSQLFFIGRDCKYFVANPEIIN